MPRKPKPLIDPFRRPERLFYRKILVREPDGSLHMYLENPGLSFGELRADELLTVRDLQRLFDCTARTIYRWVAEEELKPDAQLGRDYLFRKDKLMKWYRRTWE